MIDSFGMVWPVCHKCDQTEFYASHTDIILWKLKFRETILKVPYSFYILPVKRNMHCTDEHLKYNFLYGLLNSCCDSSDYVNWIELKFDGQAFYPSLCLALGNLKCCLEKVRTGMCDCTDCLVKCYG